MSVGFYLLLQNVKKMLHNLYLEVILFQIQNMLNKMDHNGIHADRVLLNTVHTYREGLFLNSKHYLVLALFCNVSLEPAPKMLNLKLEMSHKALAPSGHLHTHRRTRII